MTAVFVLGALGVLCVVSVVLAFRGPGPKEKHEAAVRYVEWLRRSPSVLGFTDEWLARERFNELASRSYRPTKKDAEEMILATYVIEGWHRWNGAVV